MLSLVIIQYSRWTTSTTCSSTTTTLFIDGGQTKVCWFANWTVSWRLILTKLQLNIERTVAQKLYWFYFIAQLSRQCLSVTVVVSTAVMTKPVGWNKVYWMKVIKLSLNSTGVQWDAEAKLIPLRRTNINSNHLYAWVYWINPSMHMFSCCFEIIAGTTSSKTLANEQVATEQVVKEFLYHIKANSEMSS